MGNKLNSDKLKFRLISWIIAGIVTLILLYLFKNEVNNFIFVLFFMMSVFIYQTNSQIHELHDRLKINTELIGLLVKKADKEEYDFLVDELHEHIDD